MNGKLNKILPLAGLFCGSLVFSSVFADTDTTSDNQASKSQMQEITPPAGFAAEQGIGFSVYGDFIYWEARESNLGFAATNYSNLQDQVIDVGETFFPSFKYKPGFKAGIAFDLGHDNWDLDANYTWLNGSAAKNSVKSTGKITNLYNLQFFDGSSNILDEADSSWSLHHNLINVDLGRDYYISQYLTLRPYFGLSGAWNNQKQIVHYSIYGEGSQFISLSLKQNYWGVGFNTGLQTNWCFDENWAIYGNFGVMNLWSKYHVQSKETDYNYDANKAIVTPGTVSANTQSTQYGLQNVLDLEVGVRWGMTFDDDTMGVSIQGGWEQQVWINHAQFANTESSLSLQGLTARLRLDF